MIKRGGWACYRKSPTSHQVICYYKSNSQRTLSHLASHRACFVSSMKWPALCSFRHSIKDLAWKVCLRWTQQCPSSRVQQTWSGLCERCLWKLRTQGCAWSLGHHSKVHRQQGWQGRRIPRPVFEASAQGTAGRKSFPLMWSQLQNPLC